MIQRNEARQGAVPVLVGENGWIESGCPHDQKKKNEEAESRQQIDRILGQSDDFFQFGNLFKNSTTYMHASFDRLGTVRLAEALPESTRKSVTSQHWQPCPSPAVLLAEIHLVLYMTFTIKPA
jgi:hypothetical protein